MKRECGEGELIPIEFTVVSCFGKSDDETEVCFSTLQEALEAYNDIAKEVSRVPCSNVRLYAWDKQGYANCVKSFIHGADGYQNEIDVTDQL